MNNEFVDLRSKHLDSESFWPSFTDIMMVVVIIFLLTSMLLMVKNWELLDQLRNSMAAEEQAEEIIHQLNSDPDLVPVKRKVFSKKGKTTSFEVVFAYNGRLYFRKPGGNRIKILTIGSKNTQQKDLLFIDNV